MQKNRYQNILYFITAVIVVTLAIQVYWNFKNYQAGKQQLINEVQISLDNAVDQYYEELAKNKTMGFASKSGNFPDFFKGEEFGKLLKEIDTSRTHFHSIGLLDSTKISRASIFRSKEIDTIEQKLRILASADSSNVTVQIKNMDSAVTISKNPLEFLTSKIIISITQEDLELQKIDSLLSGELSRKNLHIDYGLSYKECASEKNCEAYPQDLSLAASKTLNASLIKNTSLHTVSKSSYLPKNSEVKLYFTNTTRAILKENLIGILLSFLLVSAVIGCLLYLLKIINHQKQLAELKNDLISNITHEFKTPIATISAALEGIQNFNQENDPEKTKKYVAMSSTQLGKLNTMVEKILETATLDSEELELNLEELNLVALAQTITSRYKANTSEKEIKFHTTHENIWKKVDVFHFENAINNILDNAVKYGGNRIDVHLKNTNPNIVLEIKDNGTTLTKSQKDKIFEKFYRVPKGNMHDIKGFGIGLFYTRTIIEKHGGTIALLLDQEQTNFKITLPNG